MALKEKEGRDIREAIERFVRNLVRREISTAPYNQTKNGQVTKVTPHGYTVLIENKEYPNMLAINCANLVEGDVVVCAIPNGQMSQSYIVGKKVGLIQVSAGGGDVSDVQVNNVSVVTGGVANIVADTTVANTTHLVTSGAVYTAISSLTSDISNIKNGQTINSFAGVESALGGKVSLTNNGSQTIATTGTSGDNQKAPLFLKSNNSDSYIGFKDSSGTTLGYYGVDANKKPIFYDTSAKQIALTSDLSNFVSGTLNQSVSVAGTTKNTYTYDKTAIYSPNGLIMGGTAAAAGLVTRGICGVTAPTTGGACTKDNLYINYDSDRGNAYSSTRQLVLQAGSVGTHYGNNVYQYCAVRGDAFKNYIDNNVDGTITATPSKNIKRDASGNANAVAFTLYTSGESTMKASMQYNSTNESIEFIFN